MVTENKKLFSEATELQKRANGLKTEVETLSREKLELRSGMEELKAELKSSTGFMKEQHAKNEHLISTLAAMERNYASLVRENGDLANEVDTLRQYAEAHCKSKNSHHITDLKRIGLLKTNAPELYKECMSQAVSLCQMSNDLEELGKAVEANEELTAQLKNNLRDKESHLKRLEKIIDRLTRREHERESEEESSERHKALPPHDLAHSNGFIKSKTENYHPSKHDHARPQPPRPILPVSQIPKAASSQVLVKPSTKISVFSKNYGGAEANVKEATPKPQRPKAGYDMLNDSFDHFYND